MVYKAASEPCRNTRGKMPWRWEETCSANIWDNFGDLLGLLVPDGFDEGYDCPELGDDATLSLTCVSRGVKLRDGDIIYLLMNVGPFY